VFATLDGHVKVVECVTCHCFTFHVTCKSSRFRYSEISPETAAATAADGQLLFNAGNICNHIYTTSCLLHFSSAAIPYHVAHKKISAADAEGNAQMPLANNGIKLERF
jgi:UDP-N-acetylglucosamine/UDP-N-acetylgalactosamine diphosphorylase